jgi:heme/copper-type cytochrome/quinol oxidase subunit 2
MENGEDMQTARLIIIVLLYLVEVILLTNYFKFRRGESNKIYILSELNHEGNRRIFDLAFSAIGIVLMVLLVISLHYKSFENTFSLIVFMSLLMTTCYNLFASKIGLFATREEICYALRKYQWHQIESYEWKLKNNALWLHIHSKKGLGFRVKINKTKKDALEKILNGNIPTSFNK